MVKEIIVRVYVNKKSGQKLVCIPKNSDIKPGDYVVIKKLKWEGIE